MEAAAAGFREFKAPLVCILMCTYNGERFLNEQLDSLVAQTHDAWVLYISDDGSSDGTLGILKSFRGKVGEDRVVIKQGPRKGFVANFLSLVADRSISADYYCFCDQDDIWLPHKLSRAISMLRESSDKIPALYGSRTKYIDEMGKEINSSPLFSRPTGFRNALLQSICGGNTMMFNVAAKNLMIEMSDTRVISHDWWLYIVVTAAGGIAIYDSHHTVLYRQHQNSAIGGNRSLKSHWKKVCFLVRGEYKRWNDIHLKILSEHKKRMSIDSIRTLRDLAKSRESSLLERWNLFRKTGVYRQTPLGNFALKLAVIFKRY